eukprot:Awhi_evm1s725
MSGLNISDFTFDQGEEEEGEINTEGLDDLGDCSFSCDDDDSDESATDSDNSDNNDEHNDDVIEEASVKGKGFGDGTIII